MKEKKTHKKGFDLRKTMISLSAFFPLLTVVFYALYRYNENVVLYSVFVTFLTFSYHFVMRIFVGILTRFFPDKLRVPENWWFRPKRFERKIYGFLKVKNWKGKVPAYFPDAFSLEKHSLKEIAKTMCGAEITHEIIVVLSFVPVLFSIEFGVLPVFVLTSLLAAAVDCIFIVVQRYNRPRVLRLSKTKEK